MMHKRGHMILYISDPKNFTRKVLEMVSAFSKVAGSQSTRKHFCISTASTEVTKTEVMETVIHNSFRKG